MADGLSDRVREVLVLLAYGLSAEEAAGILGVTKATVMFHFRVAQDHYGTNNRTHTVVEAIGDIKPGSGGRPMDSSRVTACSPTLLGETDRGKQSGTSAWLFEPNGVAERAIC